MTYSTEENHHSGLELYFMPRFFVYNPCCGGCNLNCVKACS